MYARLVSVLAHVGSPVFEVVNAMQCVCRTVSLI